MFQSGASGKDDNVVTTKADENFWLVNINLQLKKRVLKTTFRDQLANIWYSFAVFRLT